MEIGPIIVDCASAPEPDATTLECLVCIQLVARQRDVKVELDNVSMRMRELIDFCGLSETLGVEVERQPE